MNSPKQKPRILIADDSEMNREMLADMLEDEYEILEACNGEEALQQLLDNIDSLACLLLDVQMPVMDGFSVLRNMDRYRMIEKIPVVMISSEVAPSFIEQAYDLGATDYVARPYNATIVKKRINNVILSFSKQQQMLEIISRQLGEKEKDNKLMLAILAHIVEFRNGESGLHVLHINIITEMLLRQYNRMFPSKALSEREISIICLASALHDIGKIAIPEAILNKPGRLTPEEFAIMKGHSQAGADILKDISVGWDEPLLDTAYEICRWHHERYDGRGYPDGLQGDAIPLSAQIVSVADVYDALTSVRCYKPPYSHEDALDMICRGECGTFNPVLIDCLKAVAEDLKIKLLYDKNLESPNSEASLNEIKAQLEQLNAKKASSDPLLAQSIESLLRQLEEGSHHSLILGEDMIQYIVSHNEKLYQDVLTATYNRRFYEEQLKERHNTQAVVMMDMDKFKEINDTYGHMAGDIALREVSSAVKNCIRHSDSLVRMGGDEYCIVFEDIPAEAFEKKLEIISERVKRIRVDQYPDLRFSISIGGAYGPGDTSALLKLADQHLYKAKKEGLGLIRTASLHPRKETK